MKGWHTKSSTHITGTLFTPTSNLTEADIRARIIANFSPPLVPENLLTSTADKLLELYPDIPALGSPFNTGNETFGLPSGYKRQAAISTSYCCSLIY